MGWKTLVLQGFAFETFFFELSTQTVAADMRSTLVLELLAPLRMCRQLEWRESKPQGDYS